MEKLNYIVTLFYCTENILFKRHELMEDPAIATQFKNTSLNVAMHILTLLKFEGRP